MRWFTLSAAILLGLGAGGAAAAEAERVYQEHCASCHGADRLGGLGPALLPENLGRLRVGQAAEVIENGRSATQMPGFGHVLSAAEIGALAELVLKPLPATPRWDKAEIEASRVLAANWRDRPVGPMHGADPLNLFVVVESGDHHVSILDGDRFEVLSRFKSRFALHGGPKFTADGRYVYFGSRDGWITKYDLHALEIVAETRAGINLRNMALSGDDRFVAVANYLPHTLVFLNAGDLSVAKVMPVASGRDGRTSRVSAVYQARPRKSFVAALKDIPEIWEVSYDENAPPVYAGLVHSHEKGMEEGVPASAGLFSLRRIAIEEPLDDFMFDPAYRHLLGSNRDGAGATVVNLNVGRPIAKVALDGLPHVGSGITWMLEGRPVLATPHLNRSQLTVIDMTDWRAIRNIATAGPGFFLRSHENTPYAWTDAMLGPRKDTIQVIDKARLEVVRELVPAPGKIAAHVEFTRDGRYALVSVWENDGALVVYDAATFQEVKRLPMVKPSGKYNVWNKINLSEGTSH